MPRLNEIEPVFVELIPDFDKHEPGKVYISDAQKMATHLCACGCGFIIVTPIEKGFWWYMMDAGGKLILRPSIGSIPMPCGSNYHITHNRVEWMSREEAYKCEITGITRPSLDSCKETCS